MLRSQQFKNSLGLLPDDIMILQPTRIVRRKGIELTIELVSALKNDRCKLVLSHKGADEGYDYQDWVMNRADQHGIDVRMVKKTITSPWARRNGNGRKFSLWHIYPHANLVTLPSLQEGFGNAFLEAIYFRKPVMINRYQTFVKDIEPNGFDLVRIDGYVSPENVDQVNELLNSPQRVRQMTEHNYNIARRHYSYRVLEERLVPLVNDLLRTKERTADIQGKALERRCFRSVPGLKMQARN